METDTPNVSVSVIMPVYNGQEYILNGIVAVLHQSLENFELIIVDDGSIDNTAKICDEIATKDPHIVVFHEQHRGVAHSRQIGIEHVRGKYTIHLDPDDWYEPTMLEKMFLCAEKEHAEMVICDWIVKTQQGKKYQSQKPSLMTCESIANDIICGKLHGSLCNKLIKTSNYKDNGIMFRPQLTMREDMFFILDVLPYIHSIAHIPEALYVYDKTLNITSLTNTYMIDCRNYYIQELLFYSWSLQNQLICNEQKCRMRNILLGFAYNALVKKILEKEVWKNLILPYKDEINKSTISLFNKVLVMIALDYNYTSAHKMCALLEWYRMIKWRLLHIDLKKIR